MATRKINLRDVGVAVGPGVGVGAAVVASVVSTVVSAVVSSVVVSSICSVFAQPASIVIARTIEIIALFFITCSFRGSDLHP